MPFPAPDASIEREPLAGNGQAGASSVPPIRVVVADDHVEARRRLRELLEREDGVEVVAEATGLDAVADELRESSPRVLLLDLSVYGGSSVAHIKRLRQAAPDTHIVVLTMDDDPAFARNALDAGASAFVLKDTADTDLPAAIERAARGGEYVSAGVSARLQALGRTGGGHELSRRETEVLRLLALGHTSVEIADRLRLSPRTVETHRARIYRKLGLSTRAQIVRYAIGRGLLGS
ncbi:MAG TPA: response regulator transcription factor [Solirubrobacteraceae bacterium]|jgi:two-component system response regulator NreC|nr:response regulator transcription factor [Solirubrobacteraceae bacterium]